MKIIIDKKLLESWSKEGLCIIKHDSIELDTLDVKINVYSHEFVPKNKLFLTDENQMFTPTFIESEVAPKLDFDRIKFNFDVNKEKFSLALLDCI